MTGSRMFPFITKTWNPVAGGPCHYNCYGGGCWATGLKERNDWEKYKGEYRIHLPALKVKFKPDDFVFACDMIDIGLPEIPEEVVKDLLQFISQYNPVKFLLLTKNPQFYDKYRWAIPENVTIGATIESDIHYPELSGAPHPDDRFDMMNWVGFYRDDLPRFVSVEPILKFTEEFAGKLLALEPWAIAVGYYNHDCKLPEPTLKETEAVIDYLEFEEVTVYHKTIRRAWDEGKGG